jgi:phosphoglycolate phosphatase-like HAD superfamily hydrolase
VDEVQKSVLRPGALEILTEINKKTIDQMTISDNPASGVRRTLTDVGINPRWFSEIYEMIYGERKDMSYIIADRGLKPENVLVIDNNNELGLALAVQQGCRVLHVPEFKTPDNALPIDEIRKILYG